MPTASPSRANRTLFAAFVLLSTAAAAVHLDVLGRMAYALERGKLKADREYLRQFNTDDVATLERLSEGFAVISEVTRPSVVYIEAFATTRALNEQLEKLLGRDALRSMPTVGTGSGVILDEDGHVITNNHVVENAERVSVTLEDGRRVNADVVGTDAKTDLALLRIDADRLHPATLGDSSTVRIGHIVLAIGSPFRLGHSVSHGIISALGRSDVNVNIDYQNWFQTDAPINPGNSGGPLINTRGEVIGINTAIATENGGHQGVGFAIPSNVVAFIADRLKTDRKVVRGVLGVVIEQVTPQIMGNYGLDKPGGALVRSVAVDSPAEQAGLKTDDIILEMDGTPVNTREQLQEMVAATRPGTSVALSVWRDRNRITVHVVIGRQPDGFSTSRTMPDENSAWRLPGDERDSHQPGGNDMTATAEDADAILNKLGLKAETLTSRLIEQYEVRGQRRGAIVTRVSPSGEAYAANLRAGHIIVEANDRPVRGLDDLHTALTAEGLARGVKLKVKTPDEEYTAILQLP